MIHRIGTSARGNTRAVSRLGDGSRIASGGNWYDGAKACWIAKGAASYAASKVNLTNPDTYNLQEVSYYGIGPVGWSSEIGWIGVNYAGFETNIFFPDANYSWAMKYTNSTTNYFGLLIQRYYSASASWGLLPSWTDYGGNINIGSYKNTGITGIGEHIVVCCGQKIFIDGELVLSNADLALSLYSIKVYDASRNGNVGRNITAMALYDSLLSDAQAVAVSTAMANL